MSKIKKQRCNLCDSTEYTIKYNIPRYGKNIRIVKCKKCNLIYQNPLPSTKDIVDMYDKDYFNGKGFDEGVNYYEGLKHKKSWDYISNSRMKNIEKFSNKGKILDIGCGMGDFLDIAKKRGWNTNGLELSKYSSNIAKKRFRLNVFCGTIDEAKYDSKEFDVITMIEVIEHLENPKNTLKECNRILKDSGILVIQTGDINSLYAKIKGEKWPYILLGHLHYFSKKTLVKMLNETGFEVIKVYNGDEITLKSKYNCFWKNKNLNLKNIHNYLKSLLIDFLRKIGIGGMTIYARKIY